MFGLGNSYSQLPMQVAQMMSGIGQAQTSQQVDPWTQMMMSLIGGTGQAYPQTYTPSGFQSFLQGILPGLSSLFGGSGGGGSSLPSPTSGAVSSWLQQYMGNPNNAPSGTNYGYPTDDWLYR